MRSQLIRLTFLLNLLLLAIAAIAQPIIITSDVTIDDVNAATYAGRDITIRGCTVTLNGVHTWSSLTIERNGSNVAGVLTHGPEYEILGVKGFALTVTNDVSVQGIDGALVASKIDVTGKGYNSGTGPGHGTNTVSNEAGGGAYGGPGGNSSSGHAGGASYGSMLIPNDFGSAGGNASSSPNSGGDGGGCIRLIVDGTLTLDGSIRSNGANGTIPLYRAGGGAGGTIYIEADQILGSGTIQADGGNGAVQGGSKAGSGSGGRIAIYAASNLVSLANITAYGALTGQTVGGGGTIITRFDGDAKPSLYLKNIAATPIETPVSELNLKLLDVGAFGNCVSTGDNEMISLHIGASGILTHPVGDASLHLMVAEDATIDLDGKLHADSRGYVGGTGPGAGMSTTNTEASGAAYGGTGTYSSSGEAGGTVYGSAYEPNELGSGGGNASNAAGTGGTGGGVIRLTVGGDLTIAGTLTANGGNGTIPLYRAGGGAGGSIWIETESLIGNGTISANGGSGAVQGGSKAGAGGGGRIAIYYGSNTFSLGSINAGGGTLGQAVGGCGTIALKQSAATLPSIYLKNFAATVIETPLIGVAASDLFDVGSFANVQLGSLTNCTTLHIGNNGILTHPANGPGIDLTVSGAAAVDAGGTIRVDGRGFTGGTGPGAGASAIVGEGGGGSYGGVGATSSSNLVGGTVYGNPTQPMDLGSGGGNASTVPGSGGSGGGAIKLTIAGTLSNEGIISANGNNGTMPLYRAGGGSGGSIWIIAGAVSGAGTITANGGTGAVNGASKGGGGGGGRISIRYTALTLALTNISAFGNSGQAYGGCGSIALKQTAEALASLYMKNPATTITETPIFGISNANIVDIGAFANMQIGSLTTCESLHIANGGILTHPVGGNIALTVNGNTSVDAGGSINADFRGFVGGAGPGAGATGSSNEGGGAGHGGEGAYSSSGNAGGAANGSFTNPIELGSGGGNASNVAGSGGTGGGAIKLTVGGVLDVNGTISAAGRFGTIPLYRAGGGAGGSIWIICNTLTGSGGINAVGGNGAVSGGAKGGGGAGGRIAAYFASSTFPISNFSATGGTGQATGGTGTVYTKLNSSSTGDLRLAGSFANVADTPLTSLSGVGLLHLVSNTIARMAGQSSIGSLQIDPGCMMTHPVGSGDLYLTVSGNATINAGGSIDVSRRGFGSNTGPGAGASASVKEGSGAGHGGIGGNSSSNLPGGNAYGDFVKPITFGSGGGNASTAPNSGGAGGGRVRLEVGGNLTVDGTILADGANGTQPLYRAGGGAGGSIWLTIGSLTGTGGIRSLGGAGAVNGASKGGGGGGGRIAIHGVHAGFTGTLNVSGGGGHEAGCPGTLYLGGVTPSVSGTLTFSDIDGPIPDTATIWFRNAGEVCGGYTQTVDLAPDGSFVAYAPGNAVHEILIKSSTWLRQLSSVDTSSGPVTGFMMNMDTNGDCDDDNEVTLTDFGRLATAFGAAEGDPNWDVTADLDRDGEVTIVDYGILASNFGQSGDE